MNDFRFCTECSLQEELNPEVWEWPKFPKKPKEESYDASGDVEGIRDSEKVAGSSGDGG